MCKQPERNANTLLLKTFLETSKTQLTVALTTPLEMASFSLKTGTTFMASRSSTVLARFSLKVGSARTAFQFLRQAWQLVHAWAIRKCDACLQGNKRGGGQERWGDWIQSIPLCHSIALICRAQDSHTHSCAAHASSATSSCKKHTDAYCPPVKSFLVTST